MTNFETVTSPSGHVYPADQRLTSDYYWDEEAPKSPWTWVGSSDMDGNLSYSFDEVTVFQHKDSKDILIAHDTGCSCPTPFEDATVSDGEFITSLKDFDAFVAENETLDLHIGYDSSGVYVELSEPTRYPDVVDQVVALRKKIEDLL
jgi:hypothetical protein